MYVRIRQDTEYYKCDDGTGPITRVLCPEFKKKFPGGEDEDGERWTAYPMPRAHFYNPKGGDNLLEIPRPWWEYYWDINSPEGARAGSRVGGGYIQFNANQGKGWNPNDKIPRDTAVLPKVDGITMGSWLWTESQTYQNVHRVLERKNGSTRVEAFLASDMPPDPAIINPRTARHKFVLGTGIDKNGKSVLMNGTITYWPLLVKSQGGRPPAAWIPDEALEFDVELIMPGTYGTLTNQGMINAFFGAAQKEAEDGWDWIVQAGLTILVDDRQAVYEGPTIGEMSLSYNQKVLLRDEIILLGQYEPSIAVPGAVDVQPAINEIDSAIANLNAAKGLLEDI